MHQILQIEYLSSDWMIISANEELPPYWKNVWYAHRITNNGTNKYLQIKEQSGDGIICLQIEVLSVNWRLICRSKNYLLIKKWSEDWCSICRLKNYLRMGQLSADPVIIFRLKYYLQTKELSTDWRITCRSKFDLQIEKPSAGRRIICI